MARLFSITFISLAYFSFSLWSGRLVSFQESLYFPDLAYDYMFCKMGNSQSEAHNTTTITMTTTNNNSDSKLFTQALIDGFSLEFK